MNAWSEIAAIVGIGLLCVFYYFVVYNPWLQKYWHQSMTKVEYLQRHSDCVSGEKIACFQCGATEQMDLGLARPTDFRRRIVCSRCKTLLWRESI
jgi:hypothetical protein